MDERQSNSGGGAAEISDEMIRSFLLCCLGEGERTRFEERLFTDDELERRVRLAEYELTDDYAFDRLSAAEHGLFDEKFLVTGDRRRMLAVSHALHSHLRRTAPAAEKTPVAGGHGSGWRAWLSGLLTFNRPALAFAGSLAALIIVAGLVWFATRDSREHVIARRDPTPLPTPPLSPQTTATPTPDAGATPSPVPTPQSTPPPFEPAPARPVVASFTLLPGALRAGGEMARVNIPGGPRDVVRLRLALESDEPGMFQSELLTDDDRHVTTVRRLKARRGQTHLVFNIPARLLKVGDYQVRLSRVAPDGSTEGVGGYYFRALSK